MSLISVKNFSAPFTKRGYLFTLLLVVLLFAILRLSIPTGDFEFGTRGDRSLLSGNSIFPGSFENNAVVGNLAPAPAARIAPPVRRDPVARAVAEPLQGVAAAGFFDSAPQEASSASARAAAPRAPDTTASSDDVLGEILGTKAEAEADRVEEARAQERRDSGNLGDVEKLVGLR